MASPNHTRGAAGLFRRLWPVLALIAFCTPWFNIVRDNADSAGMLAHLHAFFLDADLLYDDEARALRMTPTFTFVTSQGVVSNHWPAGATWIQAPGYALGLLANRVLASTGIRLNPYGVVPLLAVRAFAMLVLWRVGQAIAARFTAATGSARAGTVALLAWAVGTPLLYYASEAPLRPHVWGFAVMAAFVLAWRERTWGTPLQRAVVLGSLVGLAAGIRPQLAPAWLLVAEDVWTAKTDDRIRRLAVAAGCATAWPLLHLRLQLWMYGGSLGDYAGPLTHHVRALMLSPYHGVLSWSPVIGFGFVAAARSAWLRERAGLLIAGLVLHQLWLDAGMRDIQAYAVLGTRTWSGGTSFGARKLLDALPLLLPSTLSLAEAATRRGWGRALAAAVLALVVPAAGLHAAAFVDPETTAAVLDWPGLAVKLEGATSLQAWADAWGNRALPLRALTACALVVATPLAVASTRVQAGLHRASAQARIGVAIVLLLGGALLAHVWLAVVMVRSDVTLADDPQRMAAARAWMHPAHEATVARIPARHAAVRAILGDHAAP
ncbi:MAG: hypothetical protein AAGA54_25780 [Myxococcota bacterium]